MEPVISRRFRITYRTDHDSDPGVGTVFAMDARDARALAEEAGYEVTDVVEIPMLELVTPIE